MTLWSWWHHYKSHPGYYYHIIVLFHSVHFYLDFLSWSEQYKSWYRLGLPFLLLNNAANECYKVRAEMSAKQRLVGGDWQQRRKQFSAKARLQHLQTPHTIVSSLSLQFNGRFSRWTWVSRCQNVPILDFTGAKDDGGGGYNWSYKTCKAPVKLLPPTNQCPAFYRPDALPVA